MKKNNAAVRFSRYISELLDDYVPNMLTNSEHTLKSYRDALTLYVQFLESEGIESSGFTRDPGLQDSCYLFFVAAGSG